MGAEKEGGERGREGKEGTERCTVERQIMAAARGVWSFSMSLLRWREGDYGLCGAVKPYITLLSPSVCEVAATQSDCVPNHKTKC